MRTTLAGTLGHLEQLMNAAWPATEAELVDGWLLRSAGGVTQRANSVWPVSAPRDLTANLRAAEHWYADRRQPVIFQLTRRPEHAALEEVLDQRSYSKQSETIIMTATAGIAEADATTVTEAASSQLAGVTLTISSEPSQDWLELWWSIDGRGGPVEMEMAKRILQASPALYATAHDDQGVAVGTGRLAMLNVGESASSADQSSPVHSSELGGWGGIYSMAVHPEARRRGIATHVLNALTRAGADRGVHNYWLMVTAANAGAQKLYSLAGFTEQARYHYRQAPLRRALGAC